MPKTCIEDSAYDPKGSMADVREFEQAMHDRTAVGPWRIAWFAVEPDPTGLVWRGGDDKRQRLHEMLAREGLRFCSIVTGDLEALANAAECGDTLQHLRSIIAVPVFDRDVFSPNPLDRPVVGVVTLAGPVSHSELVKKEVRIILKAESVAKELVREILHLA